MNPTVSALELRVIEDVLGMENGYVLDFSDRSFGAFFEDFGVDIRDDRYCSEGQSKAKRLRRLLRTAEPALVGRVLKGLWEHRTATDSSMVSETQREAFDQIVARLLGAPARLRAEPEANVELSSQGVQFSPDLLATLPLDEPLKKAVYTRLVEAKNCLSVKAHLSVVILCGSVLEGVCIGITEADIARAEKAFSDLNKKAPPQRVHDWSLENLIKVLHHLGYLTPAIEKFSQGVRQFRNYVHPGLELRSGFTPDEDAARIALQVTLVAIKDVARSMGRGTFNE